MVKVWFLAAGVGFEKLGSDADLVVSFGTGMFVIIGLAVFTGLGAVFVVGRGICFLAIGFTSGGVVLEAFMIGFSVSSGVVAMALGATSLTGVRVVLGARVTVTILG